MTQPDVGDKVLAIDGGTPIRATPLPYGHHSIEEQDIEAVVQVLRSDWITCGPKTEEFEAAIGEYVGARYSVAFSSGTAALHGAAFAAGLGPGDEAVTTPFSFCATANCVLYVGATPVFADVCPDTLNIDPDEIKRKINGSTKAILPVDYAGHPADLDAILSLADEHGLVVIEDAAHALGARYLGNAIGGLSHLTVFSFHPVKHVTTGEGGMVTTNNPEMANKLRVFRNHGIDLDLHHRENQSNGDWYYEMRDLGYNYRLTDVGCALGLSQLKRLPDNIRRRREIASYYTSALSELPGVTAPTEKPGAMSSWHIYPIRLELARFNVGRKEMFQALRAENMGVQVHYIPIHLHPYYRQRFGYVPGQFPKSEEAYETIITLPLFHAMTDLDTRDVVAAVAKVTGNFAIS